MRRARRRSRRNTGRSSACTENSTAAPQDEGHAHVARRDRRRRSGSRSGCAARRCPLRRSAPIPPGRRRRCCPGWSGRTAAPPRPFPRRWALPCRPTPAAAAPGRSRRSTSSWKMRPARRPFSSVNTFSISYSGAHGRLHRQRHGGLRGRIGIDRLTPLVIARPPPGAWLPEWTVTEGDSGPRMPLWRLRAGNYHTAIGRARCSPASGNCARSAQVSTTGVPLAAIGWLVTGVSVAHWVHGCGYDAAVPTPAPASAISPSFPTTPAKEA